MTYRQAFDRAVRAWSADDGRDPIRTVRLGEEAIMAAIALITTLEDQSAGEPAPQGSR